MISRVAVTLLFLWFFFLLGWLVDLGFLFVYLFNSGKKLSPAEEAWLAPRLVLL